MHFGVSFNSRISRMKLRGGGGGVQPQAFDVPGVSENTVASNMARNRIFYIQIQKNE